MGKSENFSIMQVLTFKSNFLNVSDLPWEIPAAITAPECIIGPSCNYPELDISSNHHNRQAKKISDIIKKKAQVTYVFEMI